MRPEHQPKACFGEGVGWTRSVQPIHRVAWDTCPPRKGVDKCQASTPKGTPFGPWSKRILKLPRIRRADTPPARHVQPRMKPGRMPQKDGWRARSKGSHWRGSPYDQRLKKRVSHDSTQ